MRLAALCLLASTTAAADTPKQAPAGGVKGTVLFEGEPPERTKLLRDTDPYCAKTEKLSDAVVVTKGKLRDVVVRIKNGTAGTHAAPAQPVVIDQKECAYSPHVIAMVAGQKIVVRNSDGTFHNVHATVGGKLLWNKPQAAQEPDLTLEAAKAGEVVDIVCDVHPWMKAFAAVQDHPYFAVTGDDGAFEIKGLAPGTYTLEAWHPTLGLKSMTIKIGTGAKAMVPARFSYKASEM